MEKERIGFIGLGVMGRPMSKNLLKASYPLTVYTRKREKIEEMVKLGAKGASSPKEVAENSDIVITILPDSQEVEEVILGKEGVIEGIKPGSIVIDMSSIDPETTIRIGDTLEKKGVEMLDAPVSGGEEGAIKGELSIMVGGKREIFDRCFPIFQAMGKSITYVGSLGSGQTTKLINQIIVAINIAGISEAFSLGKKAGLPVETVFNAIRGGLAGSRVMDTKVPRFISRNFDPGFKLDLHIKDLKNALLLGKKLKVPLPFTSLVQQIMISLSGKDMGDKDHSILVKFWEDLLNLQVK